MLTVRCYHCGTAFQLSRAEMEQAVTEGAQQHAKTHTVHCIKCRKAIKVPIQQIQRFLPRRAPEASRTGAEPAASEPAASEPVASEPEARELEASEPTAPTAPKAAKTPKAAKAAKTAPRSKRGTQTKRSKAQGA